MIANGTSANQSGGSGPRLECGPLPAFDESNLESVRHAFQSAAPCSMGQAWQAKASENFAPAMVRTGWRDGAVLIYAELTDTDIFTRADGLNQRTWELGDAFEMFLRPEGQEAYVELQVTPNNQRLQLRYANRASLDLARQSGSCEHALIPGAAFRSRTWIEESPSRWHVFAEVSALLVCGSGAVPTGGLWHFSFSRYDYTRGQDEPVISSTSPHAEANFHRQEEWGLMIFKS